MSSLPNPSLPLAVPSTDLTAPATGGSIGEWFGEDEPTIVDEVYSQILLMIIRGEFSEGSVLTSTRLADELNVSRTPIVAALDRLVADGILLKEKNKRAVVGTGAAQFLLQVHQLREILEPPAASLAATLIPEDVLSDLEKMARAAEPSEDCKWLAAARDFDYALHLAIADHCGNLPLRKSIYKCWSYKRLSYEAGFGIPRNLDVGYREHVAILQALARRDAATAAAAMLFHLRSAAYLTADRGII
jgi:DNA-binding GntR family transcriptional regulator